MSDNGGGERRRKREGGGGGGGVGVAEGARQKLCGWGHGEEGAMVGEWGRRSGLGTPTRKVRLLKVG